MDESDIYVKEEVYDSYECFKKRIDSLEIKHKEFLLDNGIDKLIECTEITFGHTTRMDVVVKVIEEHIVGKEIYESFNECFSRHS